MKFNRRKFLKLSGVAPSAVSRIARAQVYPARPVRIVCGFPPGGINDTYARLIGQWLSQRLGQSVIVENRPGAGGNIATESVIRAAPDGYSLLLATSTDAWNATLYQNLKYNFAHDVAAVATIARATGVLVVNPSFPAMSVRELIAYAKSNPGKATVGSAGVGSLPHMFWELFRNVTGVEMLHVPYRGGGPAVIDLLAGQVQVYFGTSASTLESVRAGKLRSLAVTGAARMTVLPDTPALSEFVPGFEASVFIGVAAPRGTPSEIVDELNRQINLALAVPHMTQSIAALGDTPLTLSPAEFTRLIVDETAKWAKVIRTANIRAE
jgi:tripartite-type tricarboxylate transporter receptor subunit TctC